MAKTKISRRRALQLGAAAAAMPLVHMRTSHAAGKISVGFWDHWVPAGNDAMRAIVQAWAEKTKTEVQIDFITSVGNKNLLTIAAEAQAKTGHDILAFPTWEVIANARLLEPMDDVVGRLQAKYGKLNPISEYLGKAEGAWRAMPAISGSQMKPACTRIDMFKQHAGIDIQAMFPASDTASPDADKWTWGMFLEVAEKMHKGGAPFGLPLGQFTDAVDWVGGLFTSHGATLVDAKGNITVKSDQVRQVLDYAKRLVPFLPGDVFSWDDGSNNRWLISGRGSLIFNPPSAWAVAKRDAAQVAAQCWTHPSPAGPRGRFEPYLPYLWGVWSFSKNKTASKELIEHLSEREQAQKLVAASAGYDIPPFESMSNFDTWEKEGPPTGSVYNYPIRAKNKQQQSLAAFPAPPEIAVQIYNQATMTKMIARCTQGGESIDQTIAWAERELNGFKRG